MSTTATKRRPPLMLPGQSAAPEGPVDMAFMYVMHHGYRRDLTAFVAAAKATPAGDRAAWEALEQRWQLFSHILHLHHTAEDDAIWPFLMDRVDAEGRATLQAMEAEHDQIDPLLQACADGFATLARKPDDDVRAALVVRLTATRECLSRHLAHEETDAIALIQSSVTAEAWLAIEKDHARDGRRVRDILRGVPWAAHGLPPEARATAFADAGRAFFLVWLATRGAFERRERRAFRYV